jgi:serine/threonine-protein kinase RsbW
MPEHELHLTVGSRFENVELVQAAIDEAIAARGADEDARHWVGLAVREAVANAIKHGNRQDPEKEVEVELAIEGDQAVIRIEDCGEGFDPDLVGDPLEPENLLKPNGRGIFYMKSFMDEISYSARPGGGTVVTLKKKIAEAPPEKPSNQAVKP